MTGHTRRVAGIASLVLPAILVTAPMAVRFSPVTAMGFLLGNFSHLTLDACTATSLFDTPRCADSLCCPSPCASGVVRHQEGVAFVLMGGIALLVPIVAIQ